MSELPARNRVIYQSEALFVSPDTTGHHMYYMPPRAVKNATELSDCIVDGTDVKGNPIQFNACMGVGGVEPSADFKFKTYSSNIYHQEDNKLQLTGRHPVLADAGFSGAVNGAGLQYLVADDDNPEVGAWSAASEQLKRVQNANYSFTINRQDVNQFGNLGRIDAVVLEAPTVNMDFSYYLTDLENERLLGMSTDGKFQNLSGMMTRAQNNFGNSFFILTVPEGRDAVLGDQQIADEEKTVISVGNGYVTDYSIEASVGSFPTASVTVEGLNIKSDIGANFKDIPAIDPNDGTLICDRKFILPPSETGQGESVLKPGDINIDLANAGLISKQISGRTIGYGDEDIGSAHIQSFTLTTPLGRTSLQRLGTTYTYAKEVDFPVTCTLSVNALVSDLKNANLVDLICGKEYDLQVKVKNPACVVCEPNSNDDAVIIDFRKAVLDSESFSSSIGDNKSVDLTFSTQIGGPEEQGIGVFISGFENKTGHDGLHKSFPMIEDTGDGHKYFKYGVNGTTGIGYSAQGEYVDGWSTELIDRTKSF